MQPSAAIMAPRGRQPRAGGEIHTRARTQTRLNQWRVSLTPVMAGLVPGDHAPGSAEPGRMAGGAVKVIAKADDRAKAHIRLPIMGLLMLVLVLSSIPTALVVTRRYLNSAASPKSHCCD